MQKQSRSIGRIFHEPLLQFLIIGVSLFVLYAWLQPPFNNSEVKEEANRLIITEAEVRQLYDRFSRTRGRQPTLAEQQSIIDEFVRESIYYREALALNLDKDDPVIRNRLRQKFSFLHEDLNAFTQPSEQELKIYFETNRDQYLQPGQISFAQVYLGKIPGNLVGDEAQQILNALQRDENPARFGKTTLLPATMQEAFLSVVSDRFGEQFAKAIQQQPAGQWVGPIDSAFGSHLVKVTHRKKPIMPKFNQISERLLLDYRYEQRKLAAERLYRQLREDYEIIIQLPDDLTQHLGYQQ